MDALEAVLMLTFPDNPVYSGVAFHDAVLYSYPAHCTSRLISSLVSCLEFINYVSTRAGDFRAPLSCVSQAESPLRMLITTW